MDGPSLGLGLSVSLRWDGAGGDIPAPGEGEPIEAEGLTTIHTEGGSPIETEAA